MEPITKHSAVPRQKRRWILPLLLLLAALAGGILFLSCRTGIAPRDLPLYFADQAKLTESNSDARGIIEGYASYQSVTDQRWKAGSRQQRVRLVLPDKVTRTVQQNGKKVVLSGKNPIIASPHIYVDLDQNGKFSEKECVYNPVTKDRQGNITDYGTFLKPGNEIRKIRLSQALPAGQYDARLLWTGLLQKTHEAANPMSFQFRVKVS